MRVLLIEHKQEQINLFRRTIESSLNPRLSGSSIEVFTRADRAKVFMTSSTTMNIHCFDIIVVSNPQIGNVPALDFVRWLKESGFNGRIIGYGFAGDFVQEFFGDLNELVDVFGPQVDFKQMCASI